VNKKLLKLLLLKLLILGKLGIIAAVFTFGLAYFGVSKLLGFFIGLFCAFIITNNDEREFEDKAILNFPLSTYFRRSRPPRQPEE
jgi:hypothetical protein